MDRIDAMKAFVAVATEGSFTKAANKTGSSNQLMSKYVQQLETHLGTRLFNRTTRKIHLTEAGEQCLEHAKHILESVSDMEGDLGQLRAEAHGTLRISAPASFARLHMPKLIHSFKHQHPGVTIDLQLNDRKIDVIEEGFDVALRIGHLTSSSLIAKKIAPIHLVLSASSAYLKKWGEPQHPSELIKEHYLIYSYVNHSPADSDLMKALKQNTESQAIKFTANNGEVLTDMAIAGNGYILQPTFIVGEALKQKKLKRILESYEPEPLGLYAVYPHRKLIATKLRAFIDFLDGYFGDIPYWDKGI